MGLEWRGSTKSVNVIILSSFSWGTNHSGMLFRGDSEIPVKKSETNTMRDYEAVSIAFVGGRPTRIVYPHYCVAQNRAPAEYNRTKQRDLFKLTSISHLSLSLLTLAVGSLYAVTEASIWQLHRGKPCGSETRKL